MGYYASPFYSDIVNLYHSCRPVPLITTYRKDFRKRLPRYMFLKLKAERARIEAEAVIRRKKASNHIDCSKHKTVYQMDFINYQNELKLMEGTSTDKCGFIENETIENKPKKKDSKGENDYKVEQNEKSPNVGQEKGDGQIVEDIKTDVKKVNKIKIPNWKKKGWRDKKACWIRPLSERKEYKPDMTLIPTKLNCKRCNDTN